MTEFTFAISSCCAGEYCKRELFYCLVHKPFTEMKSTSDRKTYGSYKLLNMNKTVNGEKRPSYLDSLRSRPLNGGIATESDSTIPEDTEIEQRYYQNCILQSNHISSLAIKSTSTRSIEQAADLRKVFNAQSAFSYGLRLTAMNLTFIPEEIGSYPKLQTVFLDNNRYFNLKFHLDTRRINSFPPEFFQLTSLSSLFLNSNELSSLPFEFCNKYKLTSNMCLFAKAYFIDVFGFT
jgi:Leucine-rich repeat (LRR) protein